LNKEIFVLNVGLQGFEERYKDNQMCEMFQFPNERIFLILSIISFIVMQEKPLFKY